MLKENAQHRAPKLLKRVRITFSPSTLSKYEKYRRYYTNNGISPYSDKLPRSRLFNSLILYGRPPNTTHKKNLSLDGDTKVSDLPTKCKVSPLYHKREALHRGFSSCMTSHQANEVSAPVGTISTHTVADYCPYIMRNGSIDDDMCSCDSPPLRFRFVCPPTATHDSRNRFPREYGTENKSRPCLVEMLTESKSSACPPEIITESKRSACPPEIITESKRSACPPEILAKMKSSACLTEAVTESKRNRCVTENVERRTLSRDSNPMALLPSTDGIRRDHAPIVRFKETSKPLRYGSDTFLATMESLSQALYVCYRMIDHIFHCHMRCNPPSRDRRSQLPLRCESLCRKPLNAQLASGIISKVIHYLEQNFPTLNVPEVHKRFKYSMKCPGHHSPWTNASALTPYHASVLNCPLHVVGRLLPAKLLKPYALASNPFFLYRPRSAAERFRGIRCVTNSYRVDIPRNPGNRQQPVEDSCNHHQMLATFRQYLQMCHHELFKHLHHQSSSKLSNACNSLSYHTVPQAKQPQSVKNYNSPILHFSRSPYSSVRDRKSRLLSNNTYYKGSNRYPSHNTHHSLKETPQLAVSKKGIESAYIAVKSGLLESPETRVNDLCLRSPHSRINNRFQESPWAPVSGWYPQSPQMLVSDRCPKFPHILVRNACSDSSSPVKITAKSFDVHSHPAGNSQSSTKKHLSHRSVLMSKPSPKERIKKGKNHEIKERAHHNLDNYPSITLVHNSVSEMPIGETYSSDEGYAMSVLEACAMAEIPVENLVSLSHPYCELPLSSGYGSNHRSLTYLQCPETIPPYVGEIVIEEDVPIHDHRTCSEESIHSSSAIELPQGQLRSSNHEKRKHLKSSEYPYVQPPILHVDIVSQTSPKFVHFTYKPPQHSEVVDASLEDDVCSQSDPSLNEHENAAWVSHAEKSSSSFTSSSGGQRCSFEQSLSNKSHKGQSTTERSDAKLSFCNKSHKGQSLTDTSHSKLSLSNELSCKQSSTERFPAERSFAEKSFAEQSVDEQSSAERFSPEQSSVARKSTKRPGERYSANQLSSEELGAELSLGDNSHTRRPMDDSSRTEQSLSKKFSTRRLPADESHTRRPSTEEYYTRRLPADESHTRRHLAEEAYNRRYVGDGFSANPLPPEQSAANRFNSGPSLGERLSVKRSFAEISLGDKSHTRRSLNDRLHHEQPLDNAFSTKRFSAEQSFADNSHSGRVFNDTFSTGRFSAERPLVDEVRSDRFLTKTPITKQLSPTRSAYARSSLHRHLVEPTTSEGGPATRYIGRQFSTCPSPIRSQVPQQPNTPAPHRGPSISNSFHGKPPREQSSVLKFPVLKSHIFQSSAQRTHFKPLSFEVPSLGKDGLNSTYPPSFAIRSLSQRAMSSRKSLSDSRILNLSSKDKLVSKSHKGAPLSARLSLSEPPISKIFDRHCNDVPTRGKASLSTRLPVSESSFEQPMNNRAPVYPPLYNPLDHVYRAGFNQFYEKALPSARRQTLSFPRRTTIPYEKECTSMNVPMHLHVNDPSRNQGDMSLQEYKYAPRRNNSNVRRSSTAILPHSVRNPEWIHLPTVDMSKYSDTRPRGHFVPPYPVPPTYVKGNPVLEMKQRPLNSGYLVDTERITPQGVHRNRAHRIIPPPSPFVHERSSRPEPNISFAPERRGALGPEEARTFQTNDHWKAVKNTVFEHKRIPSSKVLNYTKKLDTSPMPKLHIVPLLEGRAPYEMDGYSDLPKAGNDETHLSTGSRPDYSKLHGTRKYNLMLPPSFKKPQGNALDMSRKTNRNPPYTIQRPFAVPETCSANSIMPRNKFRQPQMEANDGTEMPQQAYVRMNAKVDSEFEDMNTVPKVPQMRNATTVSLPTELIEKRQNDRYLGSAQRSQKAQEGCGTSQAIRKQGTLRGRIGLGNETVLDRKLDILNDSEVFNRNINSNLERFNSHKNIIRQNRSEQKKPMKDLEGETWNGYILRPPNFVNNERDEINLEIKKELQEQVVYRDITHLKSYILDLEALLDETQKEIVVLQNKLKKEQTKYVALDRKLVETEASKQLFVDAVQRLTMKLDGQAQQRLRSLKQCEQVRHGLVALEEESQKMQQELTTTSEKLLKSERDGLVHRKTLDDAQKENEKLQLNAEKCQNTISVYQSQLNRADILLIDRVILLQEVTKRLERKITENKLLLEEKESYESTIRKLNDQVETMDRQSSMLSEIVALKETLKTIEENKYNTLVKRLENVTLELNRTRVELDYYRNRCDTKPLTVTAPSIYIQESGTSREEEQAPLVPETTVEEQPVPCAPRVPSRSPSSNRSSGPRYLDLPEVHM